MISFPIRRRPRGVSPASATTRASQNLAAPLLPGAAFLADAATLWRCVAGGFSGAAVLAFAGLGSVGRLLALAVSFVAQTAVIVASLLVVFVGLVVFCILAAFASAPLWRELGREAAGGE